MSADRAGAPARFCVVDDTILVRDWLPAMVPTLDFVASYARVEHLLDARPAAEVVVLDLHLVTTDQPDVLQGVAAIRAVVTAGYEVCVYTQEERRFVLAACLAAGARGVVSKGSTAAVTMEAFTAVAGGEMVVPTQVTGLFEALVHRGQVTLLSPRQRDVLAGRARGLTYAEMSRTLYASESSLRGYWHDLTGVVANYLQETSPGDIERALGLTPGDLVDVWQ